MSSETPVRPDLEAMARTAKLATGGAVSGAKAVLALIAYTRALEEAARRGARDLDTLRRRLANISDGLERAAFHLAEQEGR